MTKDYEIEGIDVSLHQRSIDYLKLANTNIEFVFIRGAAGLSQDQYVDDNAIGCASIGMPFGLYHVPIPHISPPAKQAAVAAKTEKSFGGRMPPVADIEVHGGLERHILTKWLVDWINIFEGETGKKMIIYTSSGFFNYFVEPLQFFADRMLWVANYDVVKPRLPVCWSSRGLSWTIWQDGYLKNVADYGMLPGAAKRLDHNFFYGTAADFYRLFGVMPRLHKMPDDGFVVDDKNDEQTPQYEYVTTTTGLNARIGPGINFRAAGTIKAKERLAVAGEPANGYVPVVVWLAEKYLT